MTGPGTGLLRLWQELREKDPRVKITPDGKEILDSILRFWCGFAHAREVHRNYDDDLQHQPEELPKMKQL